jgi:hypothetical protein
MKLFFAGATHAGRISVREQIRVTPDIEEFVFYPYIESLF